MCARKTQGYGFKGQVLTPHSCRSSASVDGRKCEFEAAPRSGPSSRALGRPQSDHSAAIYHPTACRLDHDKCFTPSEEHPYWPSTRWESIMESVKSAIHREPWNKGKIVGQKVPFKLKDIWECLKLDIRLFGERPFSSPALATSRRTGLPRVNSGSLCLRCEISE